MEIELHKELGAKVNQWGLDLKDLAKASKLRVSTIKKALDGRGEQETLEKIKACIDDMVRPRKPHKRLQAIMHSRDLTHDQLCEMSGVSRPTLSKACNGYGGSAKTWTRIAKGLGISVRDLINGNGDLVGEEMYKTDQVVRSFMLGFAAAMEIVSQLGHPVPDYVAIAVDKTGIKPELMLDMDNKVENVAAALMAEMAGASNPKESLEDTILGVVRSTHG